MYPMYTYYNYKRAIIGNNYQVACNALASDFITLV